jgi:hypothetical protein
MKKPSKRFPMGKNVASKNPQVQRRKKVAKELTELCHTLGYGTLIPPCSTQDEKPVARLKLKKESIVKQALEFGMNVPQALVDEVFPPPDPNPPTNYLDDGEAPF